MNVEINSKIKFVIDSWTIFFNKFIEKDKFYNKNLGLYYGGIDGKLIEDISISFPWKHSRWVQTREMLFYMCEMFLLSSEETDYVINLAYEKNFWVK